MFQKRFYSLVVICTVFALALAGCLKKHEEDAKPPGFPYGLKVSTDGTNMWCTVSGIPAGGTASSTTNNTGTTSANAYGGSNVTTNINVNRDTTEVTVEGDEGNNHRKRKTVQRSQLS